MEAERPVSSLERFIGARGSGFTHATQPNFGKIFTPIFFGIPLILFSSVSFFLAATKRDQAFQSIGFLLLLLGFVAMVRSQLLVSRNINKVFLEADWTTTPVITSPNGIEVSPEAQRMVASLRWRFAGPKSLEALGQLHGHRSTRTQKRMAQHSWMFAAAILAQHERELAALPPQAFELMERAAFEYNRTVGICAKARPGGDLERLRGAVLRGADEAMVEIFHQVQILASFPEHSENATLRLTPSANKLQELGDRVAAIADHEAGPLEGAPEQSNIDGVLAELRLEHGAIRELAEPTVEDDDLRQQT